MKRIVTIQDISCFGRCSITVALPILSALGIETVILPTAILSTHTGEFKDYSFLSLSDEMHKITNHWKKENIEFDAIYVGYIGSVQLTEQVCKFIDEFAGKNTIVYIDPAMADNAKLYSGLTPEYVSSVKKLCKRADIISPNIYEAMLLTDEECTEDYSFDDAKRILHKLTDFCPKAIITGIHSDNNIYSYGYDKTKKADSKKTNKKIEGMFYGTGDIFSSVFIGTYLDKLSFYESISFAADFVEKCIFETLNEKDKYWYGINFEKCLNELTSFYITHSENKK